MAPGDHRVVGGDQAGALWDEEVFAGHGAVSGVPCDDERPQLFLEKEKNPLDPLLAGGVGLKDTVIVEELAVFLTVSDGVASRAPRTKVAIDLLVEEPRPIG